jgi:hypothetical protein
MTAKHVLHILLGAKADTAAWAKEHPGEHYVAVSPHGSGTILRGLSGPINVLTFESWGTASAKLIDAVERDLAIIQATQPKPASPADELRQAAQHIRDTASKASPEKWRHEINVIFGNFGDHPEGGPTAAHIALWDPSTAELVAALLDDHARGNDFLFGHDPNDDDRLEIERLSRCELAVARAINAKAANT